MPFKEIYLNYRCPRYEQMPSIQLYKDQVVSVLEEYIAPFIREDEKLITSSMINNYVKHKIIKPPMNKKYDREHIAFLYIICLLKRFMPIEQIKEGMQFVISRSSMRVAYDMFCDEFENALQKTFGGNIIHMDKKTGMEIDVVRAAASGLANFVHANVLISQIKEN